MAKLQLACDLVMLDDLMGMMPELVKYVDIFEMGTPLTMRYGITAPETIRKYYPNAVTLADVKIFDGGKVESTMYIDAGVSYVTVMSRTNDATIKACADACHARNAKCVVDMMCETDFKKRVPELEALGADILAVHVAVDDYTRSGITPLKSLEALSKEVKTATTAAAGGIKLGNVKEYLQFNPEIIVVGSAIWDTENPVETTRMFAEAIH